MSLLYQKHASRPLTLDNRVEPELYRDVFPYTHVSRIEFDDTFLVPRPADPMFITDTTFRDGQQARPPYTVKQIARIYDLLHKLGGKSGLIQASEFFMYSPKDRKAIEVCRSRGYRFPRVTGWIRANMDDLKIAHDMEFDEVGLLTSMSDYHIFLKLGKTREQAMNDYLKVVTKALEWGIVPRCHFEDVTRADIYGFCLPFARKLMELSHEASMPIKIRLCDTMGYGVPFPGAALPRSVQRIVRAFTDEAGVPGAWLEWHGHNDFHKVLVNGVTAWLYGCGGVNGTLMGFGERTGNAPLEALVIDYISLTGNDEAADPTVITEIAQYFEKELDYRIPDNYPFAGKDFNAPARASTSTGWRRTKRSTTSSTPPRSSTAPCRSSSTTRRDARAWPTGSTSSSTCRRNGKSPRSIPPSARSTPGSWPPTRKGATPPSPTRKSRTSSAVSCRNSSTASSTR